MKIHNHITVQIPHDLQHRMRPGLCRRLASFRRMSVPSQTSTVAYPSMHYDETALIRGNGTKHCVTVIL